jgi:hypothetical protein
LCNSLDDAQASKSVSCCLSRPDTGPPPQRFYDDYGSSAETDYLTQLLADLAATAERNLEELKRRHRALTFAIRAPVLLTALYGLLAIA